MPTKSRGSRPLVEPPTLSVAGGDESARTADATVSTWREIDEALRPVVGQGGLATLYSRSLHIARQAHPWLGAVPSKGFDPLLLRAAMLQQSSSTAYAGSNALLHAFKDLLTSLVGASLTERMLGSVWTHNFSGPAAQDNSP